MAIFDTHAHYFDEAFDEDREELIKNVLEDNVAGFVEIGDNIEHSKLAIERAKTSDKIYCAVGIHPENVEDGTEENYALLEEMIKNKEENRIVAIGEIGLDYYWTKETIEEQKVVFRRQLDLAIKYDMPVVIHSRESHQDTYEIIEEYAKKGLTGIMHCFPGSVEMARMYEKLGFKMGIGGVLTFKNPKKLVDVVKELDMKNFVLETDCPYMTPEPHRGERNDSRMIRYVVSKIAELKGITEKDVEDITYENALEVYKLKK